MPGTEPARSSTARRAAQRAQFEAQVRATRAQLDAMDAAIQARTGRNLPLAILIGLVLGAAVLCSLIFVKAFFMIIGAALIGSVVFELASALRFAGRDVPRWPSLVTGVLVIPVAFFFHGPGLWFGFLGAVVVVMLWRLCAQFVRTPPSALLPDLGAIVFVHAYTTLLGSFAVVLAAEDGGQWWALGFLIVVVVADTGAYVSGLLFGRHKMAPRISPGKTWEGFAGSVVISVIAGLIVGWLMLHIPLWEGALFGLALVLSGTLGDLTESVLKRGLGIKDISTWLPGHGGFLDRVDSTLTSAPVAFLLFLLFT